VIDLIAIPELKDLLQHGLNNNPGLQKMALAIQTASL